MTTPLLQAPAESRLQVRSWLEAILGIARRVNEQAPLEQVLDQIASVTCELGGYDFSAVLIPNEEGTALYIHGSSGLAPGYVRELNARRPLRLGATDMGEAPSSRALRYRRPVALRDIWEDESCALWEAVAHEQGNRSLLSLPLLGRTEAVGVLNCYTREPRDVSDEDIVFMETIADQAALAVETATLRARERSTIERLHAVNLELSEHQTLLENTERAQRTLMRAVLENGGLDGLAASIAQLVGGAVVIDDPKGSVLASSGVIPDDTLQRCRQRLDALAWSASEEDDDRSSVLTVPVGAGPDLGQRDEGNPRSRLTNRTAVVAPIYLDHGLAGRVWFVGGDGPSVLEHRVLEAASIVGALVMSREQISQEARWRVARELVDELLWRGDLVDPDAAIARGRKLGLELDRPHILIVVRCVGKPAARSDGTQLQDRSLLSRLQGVVEQHGVGAAVPGRAGESILLWPADDALPVDALARAVLQRSSGGGTLVNGAVSTECRSLADYPHAYTSAKRALALAELESSEGQFIDVRKLGVHRVLLNAARPGELSRFADDLLGPLEAYDDKRDGPLVHTLREYFAHSCAANETAAALTVHSNTVRYRLRRIEELLDIDLGDEHQRLALSLALSVRSVVTPLSMDMAGPS